MSTKVLCLTEYYLPGYKGGGPIRTLANLRDLLAGDVEFSIFTRDRDLGSHEPYPGILQDLWNQSNLGPLFYATPERFSVKGLQTAVSDREFDLWYLNSFWSFHASIAVYFQWRRSGRSVNLLIAPRGEFSPGALALKRMKKRVYLCLARLLGLYSDVYWHASTEIEAGHILRQFPSAKGKIYIAADPVSRGDTPSAPPKFPTKNSNRLRAVFISRISPMKNLDGLIKFLGNVQQRVDLSIYGPIEDAAYWQKCMALINALPLHITVEYHGPVNPGDVQATFAAYDLFILPTQGENFGHVIFEALCAGTPVLTSDRTPWVTSVCGAVTALSLSAVEEWSTKIEEAAARCQQEQDDMRKAALEYASLYAADDTTRLKNLAMFRAVASSPRLITGFPLRGP